MDNSFNKKIVDGVIEFPEFDVSTIENPVNNKVYLFLNSGTLKKKDSAGIVSDVGTGAGGGSSNNSYQLISILGTGNTNLSIASNQHYVIANIAAGTGSYIATITSPISGRVAGDVVKFKIDMAASTNPTIEIRNATSGGVLLFDWTGDGLATSISVEIVYNGTMFQLLDAHFLG